jgi:hypothetical protein
LSSLGRGGDSAWERIKTPFRLASQKSSLQLLILDTKEIRMKFKENVIIKSNSMNPMLDFWKLGEHEEYLTRKDHDVEYE